MSKTKVEKSEYDYEEEEEEEKVCDGTCDDDCLVCLYKREKIEMNKYNRVIDCFTDMRKCMDDNYMCVGRTLSALDIIDFVEKIK